jgi:hypothetical protein
MTAIHFVSAVILTGAVAVNIMGIVQKATEVPTGTWGGDHIRLEVTSTGGLVDFDCAHGSVDEPLILDSNGRFDARGSYTRESPGPQREDQPVRPKLARYTGGVQVSTMTLTITLPEEGQIIGPFSLVKDKLPRISKCG